MKTILAERDEKGRVKVSVVEPSYQDIEFGLDEHDPNHVKQEWKWDFSGWWKERQERKALTSLWYDRNVDHGDIFIDTLELPTLAFQQNIFIERTGDLVRKLTNLSFELLHGFPDEGLYTSFSEVYYWRKHNVALFLYEKRHEVMIKNAIQIAKQSSGDHQTCKTVFVNTMKVLLSNS